MAAGALTDEARRVLVLAQDEQRISGRGGWIEPRHVLLALLRHGEGPGPERLAVAGFGPMALARDRVEAVLEAASREDDGGEAATGGRAEQAFSPALLEVLDGLGRQGRAGGPTELLLALLEDESVVEQLWNAGIDARGLRGDLVGDVLRAAIQPGA